MAAHTLTTAGMSTFLRDKASSVEATAVDDIPTIVAKQRTFFATGATRPLPFRKEQMRKLYYLVEDNQDGFLEALAADLAKPAQEAIVAELGLTLQDILHIDEWAREEYVAVPITFKFNKARLRKEPLGAVLVMGPWNYPVWCSLCPAVNALAAGNTIVLKPSEHSPHTSALLAKLAAKYFSPDVFAVVTGAIPVASALLNEKWDHIIYTGGSQGAKFVAAAAAKNLTPVTLELGGKNPCIVDTSVSDAKLELFATRIMWGKFSNAGQVCIGSDHIIIVGPPDREDLFLAYAKKAANAFTRGEKAENRMARVVNEAHFGRLEGLLKGTKGQIVHGGELDKEANRIGLTIVKGVTKDDSLMSDEIFGPLLPVLRVDTMEQAIALVRQSEIPLALYIFAEDRAFIDTILDRCPSGGVCVNDVMMQAAISNLPFGGVGASGVGFYRSKYGFMQFCQIRSITETPTWGFLENLLSSRYPPYTPEKLKKMKSLTAGGSPPFTRQEGSADQKGLTGWIYSTIFGN